MEKKFQGTSEVRKHTHVVFLSVDDNGVAKGYASFDDGHTHDVIYDPGTPPVLDYENGNKEIQAAVEPQFRLGEADGHTHDLIDLELDPQKKPKVSEKGENVAMVHELFKAAEEEEQEFRKDANEDEEFYIGKQWADDDKNNLKAEKRPMLTINEIEPKIDLLSGYQRQNRFDIKYFPLEDGDSKASDFITAFVKAILTMQDFDYEETDVFEDGLIVGRGQFNVFADYSKDVQGDLIAEHYQWDAVYYGPHRRKDLDDCGYMVKSKWHAIEELEQLFPDQAADFPKDASPGVESEGNHPLQDNPGENYVRGVKSRKKAPTSTGTTISPVNKDFCDLTKKQYRLMELWKKEFFNVPVMFSIKENFFYNAQYLPKSVLKQIETIPTFAKVERVITKMRVVLVCGNTLIQDYYARINEFSVFPFYAKKRGKHVWGKVRAVKDLQREVNKRHSQIVDIMNKAVSYGWFYDSETFVNNKDMEDFKKNAAKPGFTQQVKDINRTPKEIQGIRFPTELANLEEISTAKIKELMNINPEMLGLNSKAESGVAIAEKKRAGLVGNEYLFDNLSLTKRLLGRYLLKAIPLVYTKERIKRILNNPRIQKMEIEVYGKPISQYKDEEIEEVLNTIDFSKYDVVVGESAYSPTKRQADFLVWSELFQKGFPIDPSDLLQMSDVTKKDQIIANIQQKQKEAQAMEEKKMQTEILKAQIANGGLPQANNMQGMPR